MFFVSDQGGPIHGKAAAAYSRHSSFWWAQRRRSRSYSHMLSTTRPSAVARPGASRLAHESIAEQQQNGGAADGPEAQAYADRAYPASQVTPLEVQGAIKANDKLQKKGPKAFSKWDSIGPEHAQRGQVRHAVVHQADAVVRP